jgi:hypothetical protein
MVELAKSFKSLVGRGLSGAIALDPENTWFEMRGDRPGVNASKPDAL